MTDFQKTRISGRQPKQHQGHRSQYQRNVKFKVQSVTLGEEPQYYFVRWKNVTSDTFSSRYHKNWSVIKVDKYSKPEFKVFVTFISWQKVIVNNEVAKLGDKKVISKANIKDKNTFASGVFTTWKKESSKSLILNLTSKSDWTLDNIKIENIILAPIWACYALIWATNIFFWGFSSTRC